MSATVILVIGGNEDTNKEAWAAKHLGDRDSLDLFGRQNDLGRAILETRKPTVVFLINSGPLAMNYVAENVPAILEDYITKLWTDTKNINYKFVIKYVSEINRRAERLHSNLFPQEKDNKSADKVKTSETEDLKTLLNLLDTSITDFVHSPIFRNLNVVNFQESQKAQKDLTLIIEISSAVKEKAGQLLKK